MQYKFIAIPESIATSKELSSSEKLVAGVIIGLINNTGKCYATNYWIAKQVDVTSRTVSSAVTKLFDMGYLKESRSHRKDHVRVLELKHGAL